MNVRMKDEGGRTKQRMPAPRARSSFVLHPSSSRPAFTLTEILVVIGIIVLMLALAVPAFNLLSGNRSIDGAENVLSALLGRARSEAIGLQRDTGVLFFLDPATDRVNAALVYKTDEEGPTINARQAYLDLVDGAEFVQLPVGIRLQVIDNADVNASNVRQDDGYMGFNRYQSPSGIDMRPGFQVGGVILFDAQGRLVSLSYGFDLLTDPPAPATPAPTRMNQLLYGGLAVDATDDFRHPPSFVASRSGAPVVQRSAFGFVMVDAEQFGNNGNDADPQAIGPLGSYATNELGEETWLDDNATAVLINRYNGTLVRGE